MAERIAVDLGTLAFVRERSGELPVPRLSVGSLDRFNPDTIFHQLRRNPGLPLLPTAFCRSFRSSNGEGDLVEGHAFEAVENDDDMDCLTRSLELEKYSSKGEIKSWVDPFRTDPLIKFNPDTAVRL